MLRHLFWADCVSSTNDLIKKYPANSAFMAATQTSGRGRHGRNWLSERGGLYLTYKKNKNSFRTGLQNGLCAIAVGVALHKALENTNNKLYLKWPNDLLNENFEKIAGILIEVSQEDYLIGIGLNCGTNTQYANYKTQFASLWLAKLIIQQIDLITQTSPEEVIKYWEKNAQKNLNNNCQFSHLGLQGELWLKTETGELIEVQNG